MSRLGPPLIMLAVVLLSGCSGSGSSTEPTGEALYSEPHDDGNTFACATCHALEEPASDGFRRPGHPIGDAANRPSYKNEQLTELLDAVNSCRVEWMAALAFASNDSRWIALRDFLQSEAGDTAAPAITYEIVSPPNDLGGGNATTGRDTFNQTCVVCHGIDATGTERGPALRGQTLTGELVARRVRTSGPEDSGVYPGLTDGIMPFWSADRLSDDDLRDVTAFVLSNDGGGAGGSGGAGGTPGVRECESTHPKIGQIAELSTFAHSVSGTAEIIDDCTIRVDDFVYDGGGIDVRFYSGLGGNYVNGFPMSEDLLRSGGYNGDTVYAQLPVGRTLDELDGISVWCVDVAVSFGDGIFADPRKP